MTSTIFDERTVKVLDDRHFAKLVTIMPDGMPQLSIMWYRRLGDEIRMIAPADAMKTKNLIRNPKTAILVDESDYRYVEMRGMMDVIQHAGGEMDELQQIAIRYLGEEEAKTYIEQIGVGDRVILSLRPERVRVDFRR